MLYYKEFVEPIQGQAGVYSFDRLPDGSFSEIKLVSINRIFDKIAHMNNPGLGEFVPGMPYGDFAFKDPNFEKRCYQCGTSNETQYDYVHAQGFWISGIYIPLESDNENTFYVGYIVKLTIDADSNEMTRVSADVTSAVLETCINLHRSNDIFTSLRDIVRNLCDICGTRQCVIIMADTEKQTCDMITGNGVDNQYFKAISDDMHRTTYETCLAWENDIGATDCLVFEDETEMTSLQKTDPVWYASLHKSDIKNIILYSLRYQKQLTGFLWCANYNAEETGKIKKILSTVSFLIGSAITNYQLVTKLKLMGLIDTLSGVYNRNAMNNRIDEYYSKKIALPYSIGVVFADINGLKRVNDQEGHQAGDRLIQSAAQLLKDAFSGYDIYRSGGDEFLILCTGIEKKKLDQCVSDLRKISESTDKVHFSIGTVHKTDKYDLKSAMRQADEEMYADKERYYKEHPELKYR